MKEGSTHNTYMAISGNNGSMCDSKDIFMAIVRPLQVTSNDTKIIKKRLTDFLFIVKIAKKSLKKNPNFDL